MKTEIETDEIFLKKSKHFLLPLPTLPETRRTASTFPFGLSYLATVLDVICNNEGECLSRADVL